jgi:hypothetical protein
MELLTEITDLLSKYGIDALSIVAIVFMTFVLKSLDRKDRFRPGYVVFPLLSSIAVIGASDLIAARAIDPVRILIYGGLSAWLYDIYSSIRASRKSKQK